MTAAERETGVADGAADERCSECGGEKHAHRSSYDGAADPLAEDVDALARLIAQIRFGPGVDMGGAHNPRPSEDRAAREFLEYLISLGWRPPDRS